MAVALGIAVAAGLLTSFVAPRGPSTAANALFVMAVSLFLGATGGALVRSRWSLVVLFFVYFLGIEAGRLNIVGPSLDLRLDNPYGVIAFVLTRGVHSMLVLPPIAFGVLVGLAVARRLGWSPSVPRRRPLGSAMVGVIAAALAVLVAWPASTPPVIGPGRPAGAARHRGDGDCAPGRRRPDRHDPGRRP